MVTIFTATLGDIEDLPIPRTEDPRFSCRQAEAPYVNAEYGGLSRADWSVPTGCLWQDKHIVLELVDPDTAAICYSLPYRFYSKGNDAYFLSVHLWSVLTLWTELRKALALPYVKEFAEKDDGFAVSLKGHRVQIRLKPVHRVGDSFVHQTTGIVITEEVAFSLVQALDAAAEHVGRYYWRLVDRDRACGFDRKTVARIKQGARAEYLTLIESICC